MIDSPFEVVGCRPIKSVFTEQCGEQVGLLSEQLMLAYGDTCYRSQKWQRGQLQCY